MVHEMRSYAVRTNTKDGELKCHQNKKSYPLSHQASYSLMNIKRPADNAKQQYCLSAASEQSRITTFTRSYGKKTKPNAKTMSHHLTSMQAKNLVSLWGISRFRGYLLPDGRNAPNPLPFLINGPIPYLIESMQWLCLSTISGNTSPVFLSTLYEYRLASSAVCLHRV